jgi:hypothetical protein
MTPEEKIIREVDSILNDMKQHNDKLSSTYKPGDLRLACIGLPSNILDTFRLYMATTISTLCKQDWWKSAFGKTELTDNDHRSLRQLEVFSKHAFLLFFLSRLEWNLRVLASFLYPKKKFKTAPFKNLYDYLLEDLGLEHHKILLDICRFIRNSIHSNGYHIDREESDHAYELNGEVFEFNHMQPINNLSKENFLMLLRELWEFIKELLETTKVSKPSFISDKMPL